jgi:4-amino-4-deoxy-L-arabinose transferase-like glycosyltransferase
MIPTRLTRGWLGFGLVFAVFCAPLLVGLREPDMRNDESIYSYAIERILDTGEWLTPRAIPGDGPFYEKPPLKFWIIAAGMRAGLLPRDERGMRLVDALFGVVAFGYIYWIGWELGGVTCGVVALLVLFTLDPIVFDHGLRSNNMEAALVLSYAGGMFHFARWRSGHSQRSRRAHAFAVAGYFTLAFLIKFVAALFLPLVCLATLLWGREDRQRLFRGWRDWILPAIASLALISPWFAYETLHAGRDFWDVIFGAHILMRFTASLDPSHLHPWYFYFVQTWKELGYSDTQIVSGVGLAMLTAAAFRGESFLARLIFVWGVLPVAAISAGTSKLIHYAFPFWPPIGLAAGYACAVVARWIDDRIGPRVADWFSRLAPTWRDRSAAQPVRRALIGIALVSLAVAAWTALAGPVDIVVGSRRIFRNGTILRPIVIAGVLATVGGYATTVTRTFGILALCLVLPFRTYQDKIHKLTRIDHPLRSIRDCSASLRSSGNSGDGGVFNASRDGLAHPYYYYLWRTGPWIDADTFSPADVITRLTVPGKQTPVILDTRDYRTLAAGLTNERSKIGDGWPPLDDRALAGARAAVHAGVMTENSVVILLPGPFRACVGHVLESGGKPLEALAGADRSR